MLNKVDKKGKSTTFGGIDLGLAILFFIFINLFLITAFIFVGIKLYSVIPILSFLLTSFLIFIQFEKKPAAYLTIGLLLSIIACIVLATMVYDISFDGNTYRKTITYMLKEGYNPLHETFHTAVARIGTLQNRTWEPWYDAYPKGTELFATTLYSLTGNIESGKAFNFLILIATFLISNGLLRTIFSLKKYQSILCAFVLAMNPVAISQITTFYNDGSLGGLLIVYILALMYLTVEEDNRLKNKCYLILFFGITIGFNLKFSAMIFFFIFSLVFFVYWMVLEYKKTHKIKLLIPRFSKLAGFFVVCVVVGTCVIGLTSYMTNIVRYHNPFYTMVGEGKIEIITAQSPEVLKEKSHFGRFIHAFFSKSIISKFGNQLKIPFYVTKAEWEAFVVPDIRQGGWGVFFSGILIISFIIVVVYILKMRKNDKKIATMLTLILLTTFIPIFFIPGLFWARYFVYLFLIPVFALAILLSQMKTMKLGLKTVTIFLASISLINCFSPFIGVVKGYKDSREMRKEFTYIKAVTEKNPIKVKSLRRNDMNGPIINMMDAGIKSFKIDNVMSSYDGTIYRRYELAYQLDDDTYNELRNLDTYLNYLRGKDYLVMFSVFDEGAQGLSKSNVKQLQQMGFQSDFKNGVRKSFIGIIDGKEMIYEEMSTKSIKYENTIDNMDISVTSRNVKRKDKSLTIAIRVNGTNHAVKRRGLNIVVVDKKSKEVIDSVCFDTHTGNRVYRDKITPIFNQFKEGAQ